MTLGVVILFYFPFLPPSNHCCLFIHISLNSILENFVEQQWFFSGATIISWCLIFLVYENENICCYFKIRKKIKMNTRFLLLEICQHAMLYLSCLSSWLSYLATTFYGIKCMNIFLCTWTYRLFFFASLFKKCFNFF